jgi:Na+/H+ antiporter NhaD/arsenite permease-like protein
MLLAAPSHSPSLIWASPFLALLLCIAILPLTRKLSHWWEHNQNKLIVGLVLGVVTLGHYMARDHGVGLHDPFLAKLFHLAGSTLDETGGHHLTAPGLPAALGAVGNAMMEYLPFIVLLFSLYTICGGINLTGDIPAHPITNTSFLAAGAVLASFVGTTGASMLLIRPLLQTNSERRHVAHTVIFFIFLVSNIGGCLLPIGDPPLFLGYLRGVPFLWTFQLWKEWLFCVAALLIVYYAWDHVVYHREPRRAISLDELQIRPLRVKGLHNLAWLALVILAVGTLDPSKPLPGTSFTPPPMMREIVLLMIVALAWYTTKSAVRHANKFNFVAIGEVACLFIGIFLTMQVPLEILHARGAELGLTKPWHFFWATGGLSSFLDNAPTYVVFFETANALTTQSGPGILRLMDGQFIREDLLIAISLGAVFMGANTYIGNGPNFMVKSIAETSGVKMPSFFGYMLYAVLILIPLFLLVTVLFVH